jgi:HAD superfamily hydrolase (TIGR01549 family)
MDKIDVDVIIFDQGNTLLMDPFQKIMELKGERFSELFKKHGMNRNPEEIKKKWTESYSRIDYPYIGQFFQEEPTVRDALRLLGVPSDISDSLVPELLSEYRLGLKDVIESDPRTEEVRRTLEQLKNMGKRLGVFSNDRTVSLNTNLESMGIKKYFEYVKASEEIKMGKPDPRIFSIIQNFFQVSPERMVYVGDNPAKDIDSPKRKGWKVILYVVDPTKYNQPWRNYNVETEFSPDAKISRFNDLLDVII